ncbi:Phage_int_SAM_5 domain-containing protein [Caenorhabditis elegans]|uniref:Phage_int_SAM_5 domain-containing protein n=1 Tax=Caenorhabditis elegans TaxID=6239 RepID=Q17590_CAEEL|nr:Phage_int_SAM_5 domain-containing protein [Caenorhabditis elegans]CAA90292.3 Phage_int_SAM_5 domain-containing protein [Caenorhabditis elegans]
MFQIIQPRYLTAKQHLALVTAICQGQVKIKKQDKCNFPKWLEKIANKFYENTCNWIDYSLPYISSEDVSNFLHIRDIRLANRERLNFIIANTANPYHVSTYSTMIRMLKTVIETEIIAIEYECKNHLDFFIKCRMIRFPTHFRM